MSIYYIDLKMPPICQQIYDEICNIPFYKTEDGYQYAAYLLDDEERVTLTHAFLENQNPDDYFEGLGGQPEKETIQGIFRKSIEKLSEIKVSEESLTAWITFQKEREGILEYHRCIEDLYEQIVLSVFTMKAMTDEKDTEETPKENPTNRIICRYAKNEVWCEDARKAWEDLHKAGGASADLVLNHNNPFADISIQEQQFIYGSIMGQFETLGLTTSHTLTRVAKDTERSYIALQPGFKIKKSKGMTSKKKQDILFDDTLTTEITQNDDNVYVYID